MSIAVAGALWLAGRLGTALVARRRACARGDRGRASSSPSRSSSSRSSTASSPCRTGRLAARIEELAAQMGVDVDDVLVADASRRTTTANAYVAGIGPTRRVVLYDTLLDGRFTDGEILARRRPRARRTSSGAISGRASRGSRSSPCPGCSCSRGSPTAAADWLGRDLVPLGPRDRVRLHPRHAAARQRRLAPLRGGGRLARARRPRRIRTAPSRSSNAS